MTRTNKQHRSDIESGSTHAGGQQQTPDESDADGNDKFWKLFLEEAKSEARYKVDIWKTELDNLLVFAGLFAGVLSAFLIDLRSRLNPTQATGQTISTAVIAAGGLWYGSLVVTLVGALWGVLAQRWLGEFLREIHENPDHQALDRWKRDTAATEWYMETVITGVPILTQIALAMFLIGFVFQSLDDDHAIGIEVAVLVGLGALAYAVVTLLPLFHPDCPYQTPITEFLLPVRTDTTTGSSDRKKIKILASRLNNTSNDEVFSAAASMLDDKLDGADSQKWYKGVEEHAPGIAKALSVRLTSFTQQVQKIKSVPILKDGTDSDNEKEFFWGSLSAPIENGIICLRAILRSIEGSISSGKSPSIEDDIDHIWKIKTFPVAWRLLSWSTDITRRVTNVNGTDSLDMNVAIDWNDIIPQTFSNPTLRSIAGLSACRGLLRGRGTIKRVCALGLAMFVEVDAITSASSKPITSEKPEGFEPDSATSATKVIAELWSEFAKIWKDAMVQLLGQTRGEGDEKDRFIELLLGHELYQRDIENSASGAIVKQLENTSSITQIEAMQMLNELSEHAVFREAMKRSGAIAKVVSKLENEDANIRAAALSALQIFSKHELYMPDIISTISKIILRLDHKSWIIRKQTIETLMELFSLETTAVPSTQPTGYRLSASQPTDISAPHPTEIPLPHSNLLEALWSTSQGEGIIRKLVARLADENSDVRGAADAALQTFSAHEPYQSYIKLSIPAIIVHLDDRTKGSGSYIRAQNALTLKWLSNFEVFRETLKNEASISKLGAKLEDRFPVVRSPAIDALSAFAEHTLYQTDIKPYIPAIVKKLNDEYWGIRAKAFQILIKFSGIEVFQKLPDMPRIIPLLVATLEDSDPFVGNAVVTALQTYCPNELYQTDIKSHIFTIVNQLRHKNWVTRMNAARMLTTLSEHDVYHEPISSSGAVIELISRLKDNGKDVRAAAVQALLALGIRSYFMEKMNSENAVPNLFDKLTDDFDIVRSAAIQAISTLNTHEVYRNNIKTSILNCITSVVQQCQDESWSTRQHTVQFLPQFAASALFHSIMNEKKIDLILVNVLIDDSNEDVRTVAVQALSEFGKQEMFQNASRSSVIHKLIGKLADSSASVRTAVESTLFSLSEQEPYQDDISSAIPLIIKCLGDPDGTTRQQAIQTLAKLSARPIFQEMLKTEGLVAKLAAKLDDNVMEDVRTAATEALSTLGTNGLFQDLINENVIPKLITELTSSDGKVRSSAHDALVALGRRETEFLPPIVPTLNGIDKLPVRMEVYKILTELRDSSSDPVSFLNEIDAAICKLFRKMTDKDLSVIYLSTTILAEMTNQGLIGDDLRVPTIINGSARGAVEIIVQSKLVYNKNSLNRKDTLLALSRLADNGVFCGCMKSAIPGLIDAVGGEDSSEWGVAAGAISALSKQEEFRADLVPAIQKLIQQLNERNEDEERSVDLVEAMSTLAEYKEFQMKLRHVVPQLMNRLVSRAKDVQDKTKVAFYKAACKAVSKLCKAETGRELVPQLTRVLSNMDVFLTDELLGLVENLGIHGRLTMNDRIALASSLRVGSSASEAFEIQLCKLKMAALLNAAHTSAHGLSSAFEYSSFLDAVLGKGNDAVKLKLTMLIPSVSAPSPPTSEPSQGAVQIISYPYQHQSKISA